MDMQYRMFEDAKSRFIDQIRNHVFITRCREGKASLDELKSFVIQQSKYSTHFTRYLCALMSNLPTNVEILKLAENLFEELGFDDSNGVPHHLIYKNMMEKLGISPQDEPTYPETENLIQKMLSACRHPNPAYGLGAICLGAEALVPSLYADLISGFVACGIDRRDLEFFEIHVSCDDGHAETIRDIMLELGRKGGNSANIMIESGAVLVRARLEFFSAIAARAHTCVT